ncbi:MAG: hypothetical protein AB7I50_13890 [Vicinamibacterales bacterium]
MTHPMRLLSAVTRPSCPVALLLLLLLGSGVAGCRSSSGAVVHEERGLCPFECCTYRTWVVQRDSEVRSDPRDDSPVAFTVRRGEEVAGVTGVVFTVKAGRAVARVPVTVGEGQSALGAGDSVALLAPLGNSEWRFEHAGRIDRARIPGRGVACFDEANARVACDIQVAEEPLTVWWANIRTARGEAGWTRYIDDYGNIDACS